MSAPYMITLSARTDENLSFPHLDQEHRVPVDAFKANGVLREVPTKIT